jgi:hypothetical protein
LPALAGPAVALSTNFARILSVPELDHRRNSGRLRLFGDRDLQYRLADFSPVRAADGAHNILGRLCQIARAELPDWFSKQADVRTRYDYKYFLTELEPWAARLKKIAEDAGRSMPSRDAVELKTLLFGGPLSALSQLVESYPELKELAFVPES